MENLFISAGSIRARAAFGAAFSLLLGVGIAAVVQTYAWEGSVAWVSHTFEVLGRLNDLSREIADTSGANAGVIARTVPDIERLSSDNPVEAARTLAIRQSTDRGVAGYADAAALIASMRDEEYRLLEVRMSRAHQIAGFTRRLFGFACGLSFLLAGLAIWRTRRDNLERERAEAELALREEQYRSVVENAGDLIFRTDPVGRITFCNHNALSILLLTEQEVISRTGIKLVRGDRRKRMERFYARQFLRRIPNTYCEFPVVDGHGKERWLGQNVQLIREGDQIIGFQGIAREITERKRAEMELERGRAFVERIADQTPGLLYVFDLEERRTVYCNREARTFLGYGDEPFPPFATDERRLYHADDYPAVRSHCESLRYAQDREIRRLEYRVRHANGDWVWLSCQDTPFERGATGLVKRIVGIAQDVSARKAATERLTRLNSYDEVTGLPSRIAFSDMLGRVLARAGATQTAVVLCTFSVNDFQHICVREGRETGDDVVRGIADRLRNELRPGDLMGRLGLDRFAFALAGMKGTEAVGIAERLREVLQSIRFSGGNRPSFYAELTCGIAEARGEVEARDLLEAAGNALHQARERRCGVLLEPRNASVTDASSAAKATS